MGFNNQIQTTRINVTEILQRMRASEYYVDRSFQRRLVWTEKQKVRLIETILMDYPVPEIYLWEQAPNTETGQQMFSIVDGQQRLSTLREFTSNEWPLTASYLDEDHQGENYASLHWKDLPEELRAKIYQYNINVRRIPSDISEDEIRKIFARLNETDRSLNPQEMQHATLNGEFLNAALEVADCEEMKVLEIFTKDNIRRMVDVEFASQLLGYERKGIVSDTQKSMNELYDDFSDEYPDASSDKKKIRQSLKFMAEVFQDASVRDMFETQNNVYTLHSLFDAVPDVSASDWTERLSAFVNAYKSTPTDVEEGQTIDQNIADFRSGASSRTRSKSSRTDRLFGLRNWIAEHYGEA